ncbi:MAG TPA: AsmA family protein [Terriglobales bacterium]|nr:AsmA family protein [Terriglobales bacterium]
MRKLAIVIAVIIVVVIVALLAIPKFVNINTYHAEIQKQLQQALGRPVTFGDMHLSLLPLRVRMDNLAIGEDPGFGTGSFASAQQLDTAVAFWPLLHKQVEIQSLTLRDPKVQLIKNARGVWNFSTLGKTPNQQTASSAPAKPAPAPQQPAPAQPQEQAKSGASPIPQNINITDGEITYVDQQKNFRGTYTGVNLAVNGFKPGSAFDMDASVHLPGPGTEDLALKGRVGPLDQNDPTKTPFDGQLKVNEVSLAGLQKLANAKGAMEVAGIATGSVNLKNEKGLINSDGTIKLDDAVVRNVKIGYPISLDYAVRDDLNKDLVQIDKGVLHLGSTPVTLAGTINMAPTPMQLDVHVTAKDASIQEAARLASAFGVAFSPGMNVAGKVNADVHAQGPADKPQMNGSVSADSLNISGGELKQPVSVSSIALALSPNEIRSNQFNAQSGSTKVAAQFTLTNYASPQPQMQARLNTANANVAELLSIAKAYGVSAVNGMGGSGTINLDVQAQGPVKNSSAMTFSGSGALRDASLTMPSLHAPLRVKNADLKFASNSMSLQNLNAGLGSTNATGNMTVSNFNAPNIQFTLNADKVNVAELQQITGSAPAQQPAKSASLQLIPSAYGAVPPAAGLLNNATGGGKVSIGTVQYDTLLLQNVTSNVAINHGIVKLAPINASLYGGQQTGAITIDTRPTPMDVQVSTNLQHVDANQLLSSTTSLKQTLYGLLAANGQTSFRAANAQDMARTLNGKLAIDLSNGRLARVDLLKSLAQVAQFTGVPAANNATGSSLFTQIVKLTGTFNIVNGLAQTNDLKAEIPGGSLAAVGAIGLPNNSLDLHLTAVLGKALSQQVGGSQIGGFMKTALANNQGELVIPVLVTGTFDSPRFAPDVQAIAQMRLKNLLPTSGNPGSLSSGILGAVLGGKSGQQKGVGGILGAITGQQQQQPQENQPQANQSVATPAGQQPAQGQAQPQQQNPLGDLLNQVIKKTQKKKEPPKTPQGPQ